MIYINDGLHFYHPRCKDTKKNEKQRSKKVKKQSPNPLVGGHHVAATHPQCRDLNHHVPYTTHPAQPGPRRGPTRLTPGTRDGDGWSDSDRHQRHGRPGIQSFPHSHRPRRGRTLALLLAMTNKNMIIALYLPYSLRF